MTNKNSNNANQIVPEVRPATAPPPEAYRLPKKGQRDPHFGLSRSWYYASEKAGELQLLRLRKRGNIRGVTLVPYAAVAELIKKAAEAR